MSEKNAFDVIGYVNHMSDSANKLLATLNSGAFVAFLHFWASKSSSDNPFSTLCLSPLESFAAGLTLIIITYACNYFRGVIFAAYNVDIVGLSWGATTTALLSATAFLYGVWVIALYV